MMIAYRPLLTHMGPFEDSDYNLPTSDISNYTDIGGLSFIRTVKEMSVAYTTATLHGTLVASLLFSSLSSGGETSDSTRTPKTTIGGVPIKTPSPMEILEYQERERAIYEGTVRAYEAGMRVDLRGVAVPLLDMRLLRRRDIAALKPVLDSLSNYGIPIYELDIRYVPKEDRAMHSPGFIEFEQFIYGHSVGFLRLASIKEGGNDPRSRVTGRLINPHLPQLNRKNWMPEKVAIQMAIDVLVRAPKAPGSSNWFVDQVSDGTYAGKLQLQVGSSAAGITVNPIYIASRDYTSVQINLYDGSMETFDNSPIMD